MLRLVLGLWACFWAIPAFLHRPLKTFLVILHLASAALKHSSLVENSESPIQEGEGECAVWQKKLLQLTEYTRLSNLSCFIPPFQNPVLVHPVRALPEGEVRNSLVKQHNSVKQKFLEASPKGVVRNVLVKELKVPRSIPEGDVRNSLVKQHKSIKQKSLEAPPKGNVRNVLVKQHNSVKQKFLEAPPKGV